VPDESSPLNHISFLKVHYGDNIKKDVKKDMSEAWTGFMWLRKTTGQHL